MFKILKLLLFATVSNDNVNRRQCHICKKRTPFPLFNQLTVYLFLYMGARQTPKPHRPNSQQI